MLVKQVTKAVIPAAGWGTRFFPMTKAQPKEMLPVVDKPVIQYVVEEAVASGCDDILIITGRNKRAIEDHFDSSLELEYHLTQSGDQKLLLENKQLSELADIHFIRQKEQRGLGDAILYAEHHCGDEPFAVLLGDTICVPHAGQKPCTAQMSDAYTGYTQPIIVVEPVAMEKIRDYGIIAGDRIDDTHYRITDIVEKPEPEDAPSNLGAIGRYLLTPEIFDLLKETKPGKKGEIQLTDALRKFQASIGLVTACTRYDIGDKPGWMKSNLELTLKHSVFGPILREGLLKGGQCEF
ncbi:UTP--glucose-1-phosphate uridylyltransferase GalU [Methanorbis rubei]|uniref:UTP--glucose-1-phosphate uridylyltransferase n=1 Tax=Methanorbis rubei TaxID=3028300 RepID=A0AAE4MEL8_9EURY|nr:UTP--glucose-1-phosphate uridylyltransferase [Methanocorpusculaceae archaeon Cs1]